MMLHRIWFACLGLVLLSVFSQAGVRVKDIARIDGGHTNALVGYGIVVGLAGSGDSARNRATLQSLANTLANFGVKVAEDDLSARNTAAVMVTASLSAFAEQGDRIDVQVSSIGDARSLAGGTLVLTPLYGPDQLLYALSQGPLAVGGYKFEAVAESAQKNYPTVGQIPRGASIERTPQHSDNLRQNNRTTIGVILHQADYTTAQRLSNTIAQSLGTGSKVVHPGKVEIMVPPGKDFMETIARLENLQVIPDQGARVVINEKTGTIVAGNQVQIGEISIAHGELQIAVSTDFLVSQPNIIGRASNNVRTEVVPDTKLTVQEQNNQVLQLKKNIGVGDLVHALQRLRLSTRDIISILQTIKTAGALHAELVVQ